MPAALTCSRVRQSIEQLLVLMVDSVKSGFITVIKTSLWRGGKFDEPTPLCVSPLSPLRPYTLFHGLNLVVNNEFDVTPPS
ncbi:MULTISPECIES: hypothetical protein [unclassified Paraburkholderia]|uniref:hypothetical protein n=1 Tax=unclassified Paraburkholderia TaxID=2615204 RepID=UPI002AB2B7AD|nr:MULTISPECIES: hypothetical protein [unclassified Paraburkholderia]